MRFHKRVAPYPVMGKNGNCGGSGTPLYMDQVLIQLYTYGHLSGECVNSAMRAGFLLLRNKSRNPHQSSETAACRKEKPRLTVRLPDKHRGKAQEKSSEGTGGARNRNRITESYHRRATEQHLMMKNVSILGCACRWHLAHSEKFVGKGELL